MRVKHPANRNVTMYLESPRSVFRIIMDLQSNWIPIDRPRAHWLQLRLAGSEARH